LIVQDETKPLELKHEKSNLTKAADPMVLVWDGAVLVPSTQEAQRIVAEDIAEQDAQAILDAIKIAIATGITIPAALSGPATAMHMLESFIEYGARFSGKDGRRRAKAAITQPAPRQEVPIGTAIDRGNCGKSER
jgi:hypothetical protein